MCTDIVQGQQDVIRMSRFMASFPTAKVHVSVSLQIIKLKMLCWKMQKVIGMSQSKEPT